MFRLVVVFLLTGLGGFASAQNKYLVLMPKEIRPGLIFSFQLQFLVDPPFGSTVTLSLRKNTSSTGDLAMHQSETKFALMQTLMRQLLQELSHLGLHYLQCTSISLCNDCCGVHWLHNQFVNSADPETTPAGAVSSGSSLLIGSNTRHYNGEFNVPDNLHNGTTYYFHVNFASTSFQSKYKPISVAIPDTPSFITTDRPVYKPGGTVQFMVGCFDYQLLPRRSAFKVQIKDPEGNVILLKVQEASEDERKSMYKGDMDLSTDPLLGQYSISVECGDEVVDSVRNFTVEEYVQPKFEVMLTLVSDFAVAENGRDVRVLGKVTSTYTYGENVHGVMRLFNNDTLVKKVQDFSGSYEFDIPMKFSQSANGRATIKVIAQVYEQHTYNLANDTARIKVYQSHFAAQVQRPTPYRTISETSYTCVVALTNPVGGQLSPWDGPRSQDISNYQLQYSVNGLNTSQSVADVANPIALTIPSVIEDVTVNFSQTIKIWFEYTDTNGKVHKSIADTLRPMLYNSNSNKPLRIQLVKSENEVICFTVAPCGASGVMYYQIVNKYYPEQLHVYTCSPVGRSTCFIPHPVHAPVSVIVAFKVEVAGSGKELLATSIPFSVPFTAQQKVQMKVKPSIQRPGENVNIEIHTTGQAWTGYAAVDTSAELLGISNDITLEGIQSAVEKVNLFESYKEKHLTVSSGRRKRSVCYHCGGYTKINTDRILQDAGLSYITDLATFGASGGTIVNNNPQFTSSGSGIVARMLSVSNPQTILPVWEQNEGQNDQWENKADASSNDDIRVRKHFPETWLWNLVQTNRSGSLKFNAVVPDTITNWKMKAFAFNADYGIGVATPVEVTVFQEFFLSMNLPYAVVRGEQFDLQLLVFNYKSKPVRVRVELDKIVGFNVVTIGRSRQSLTSQILVIGPSSSGIASIPISPNIIGDLLLRARATDMTNSSNKDVVERILAVKPEGREVADSRELPPVRMSDGRQTHLLSLSTFLSVDSSNIVEDSFRMYLFVTGDIMGSFLNNLEGFIRLPVGCGEQNMILLAPNIFVAMYLDAVDRFDDETRAKCVKFSEIGYGRQQRYRHTLGESAGGFSVWGQRPPYRNHASTWADKDQTRVKQLLQEPTANSKFKDTFYMEEHRLTAFVLKTFSQLAQVNLTYVSQGVLQQAFQYLNRMSEEGTSEAFFQEEGRVIHTEMQGGTSAGIGLTAFCIIAIRDYRDLAIKNQNTKLVSEIDAVLAAGMEWLRSKVHYLIEKRKPYPLALTSYALAKGSATPDDENYQKATDMLEEFENLKNQTAPIPLECPYILFRRRQACLENMVECQSNQNCLQEGELCCPNACGRTCMMGRRPRHISGPSEIEMYGYALMTYTTLAKRSNNDVTVFEHLRKAEEISQWLISKRKAGGNFETTQDTVVGLESLARYAIETQKNNKAGFRVSAMADDQYVSEWLTFTSEDYMTTKSAKLDVPSTPPFKDIQFVYEGTKGKVFTTVEALYNTKINRNSSPFDVVVSSDKDVNNKDIVRTCVRNKDKNLSISPMVTVTVSLGSGYRYVGGTDESSTTGDLRVSKVETDENKSTYTYYYDNEEDENFSTDRCFVSTVNEDVVIKNRKPANVRVLDYYNPNNTAEVFFGGRFSAGNQPQIAQIAVAVCVACMLYLQVIP